MIYGLLLMWLRKSKKMKKIGILRGLMPRIPQVEFANNFTRIKPVFITGSSSEEIINYCKKIKIAYRNLPRKQMYPIEPVSLFTRNITHQSWVGVSGLEKACADIDVLETYELYHFFSGQAADIARKRNIPLICEVWTSFLHPAYFIPPYSITVRKVINTAALFIARSYKAKDALLKLGISENKIRVIYHGVDTLRFSPSVKKRMNNQVTLLYVGELEKHKGVGELLTVWPEILKIYPNTRLILVGKGTLEAKAQSIKGIIVKGYVSNDTVHTLYKEADVFISPSINRYIGFLLWWEEFFSYTLMEAQASGLPVIATNSGGIPEEIGRENLLIIQGDEDELLSTVIALLSNEKKRIVIGDRNRLRAKKLFDIKKQTQKLEGILLGII